MSSLWGEQNGVLRQNEVLAERIRTVHTESRGIYGSPRVHRELRARGHRIGKHRVARLMRAHGIKARVATIRYTNRSLQRYFGSIPNRQLDLELWAQEGRETHTPGARQRRAQRPSA